jgi:undecaprenyl-diphosphatase
MSLLEAILLGIIQGLTEFLPVSSSGHLELMKVFFCNQLSSEESLEFTIVLHFATALSTVVILRKEVYTIFKGLFSFQWNEETQFSVKILLSMIPAVIVGLLYEEELATLFNNQIVFVGCMLLLTAVFLLLADRAKNTHVKISYLSAFIIGISQAFAMLPGVSRSGATISTSVLFGIDKSKAAQFSFLIVVPLIIGKIIKDLSSGEISIDSSSLPMLSVGFLAAFITGLFACNWMIMLVKKSKLWYFSVYCVVVGLLAIVYGLSL